jgi:hypothetical protein
MAHKLDTMNLRFRNVFGRDSARSNRRTSGKPLVRAAVSVIATFSAVTTTLAVATPATAATTTWYVATTSSGAGDCSSQANACNSLATALNDAKSGDTIVVSGPVVTQVTITKSVTIDGTGGGSPGSLTGNNVGSILTVSAGATVTVDGITITGNALSQTNGAGIVNNGSLVVEDSTISDDSVTGFGYTTGLGGGIYNAGTLTVDSSTVTGNSSTLSGLGGGIYNRGTATVDDSTVDDNWGTNGGGGIYDAYGTLDVNNSTVADNTTDVPYGQGGGIAIFEGTTTVTDSTISDNTAQAGGGIYNDQSSLTMAGDILATAQGSPSGGECATATTTFTTMTDAGFNIDDDGTCGLTASTSSSDSSDIDQFLGPLQANGGPTQTVALSASTGTRNPAQAIIPASFVAPGQTIAACNQPDQRGDIRTAECDMGSYALNGSIGPKIYSAISTTFQVGTVSSFDIYTSGNTPPSVSEVGPLPSGVTLVDNGDGTATLSGNPAPGSGGSYPIVITATNGISPDSVQNFTLFVVQAPTITSSGATTFAVGVAGTFTVTATGFPGGPTLALTAGGSLPSGVTFVDNGDGTATLSGTPAPATGGSYPITITAANGISPDATQTFTLTVTQAPIITSSGSTTFATGASGSFTVTTTGYPVSLSDGAATLPLGVTFADNGNGTATLSGTPASATGGVYPFTITASNGVDPDAVQQFVLTVDQAPAITSLSSTTFTTGAPGSFTVTTTGFPEGPTLELSDGSAFLPSGVTFVDNGNGTATLSGTPGAATGGTYDFTITASNGASPDATQNFALNVHQAPQITSNSATAFMAGVSGSFTVTTYGFPEGPTLELTESGVLPRGVTFTDNGNGTATLSGAPVIGAEGVFDLTITADNGVDPNARQIFILTVYQSPSFTSHGSATFAVGRVGSFHIQTTGFPVPALHESGSLPSGVTFSANGVISGSPAAGTAGTYPLTIGASNGLTPGASQRFVLTVTAPSATNGRLASPVAGMAPLPNGSGYWLANAQGGVSAHGAAVNYGSMGGLRLAAPIVGITSTPDGGGYWLVASDGGIFAFGDAGQFGSMGGQHLNAPIVGLASTEDGKGYWEVASDGGVFSFGNAAYHGSMGRHPLNKPVVGMVADQATGGYWEVASDGGIFSFDAPFHGSTGNMVLNRPITSIAATSSGGGYWLSATDGGIFAFGDAAFHGSMGGQHLDQPVVGMAADRATGGYWEVASDGGIFSFDTPFYGSD